MQELGYLLTLYSWSNWIIYIIYNKGVICTLTYELGLKDVVSNCSAVGLELDQDTLEPTGINFHWTYPKPEDIYIWNKIIIHY